jgi:hypothetical protein
MAPQLSEIAPPSTCPTSHPTPHFQAYFASTTKLRLKILGPPLTQHAGTTPAQQRVQERIQC